MFNILPKKCSKCGEWKFRRDFHKDKSKDDGLSTVCAECKRAAARVWAENNREKSRQKTRAWTAANPERKQENDRRYYQENKEKVNAVNELWRKKNIERVREARNAWARNHPDYIREKNKKYAKEHPEWLREKWRNRQAREKGAYGKISRKEWEALKRKYNYTCLCCKRSEPEIKLTIDHVKPLVLGGHNTIDNAQPLCGVCNSRKNAREIDYR